MKVKTRRSVLAEKTEAKDEQSIAEGAKEKDKEKEGEASYHQPLPAHGRQSRVRPLASGTTLVSATPALQPEKDATRVFMPAWDLDAVNLMLLSIALARRREVMESDNQIHRRNVHA